MAEQAHVPDPEESVQPGGVAGPPHPGMGASTSAGAAVGPAGLHGARHIAANMSRAGLAELLGAFFLIFTGTATAGAAATGKTIAGSPPNSLAVALAFGLVLTALVGALGQTSGAHLNPAVTLGLAATGKFPWRYVPSYLLAQLAGGVLGALATWATLGNQARDQAHLGATYPTAGVSLERAFFVEAVVTFLLVFVIVAVATDKRVPAAVASVSIGFALVAAVLIGGAITGGAVNPVRALGPMIVSLKFTDFWLYILAPIVGGVAAAVAYDQVVGKANPPSVGHDAGAESVDTQAGRSAGDRSIIAGS